MTRPRDYTIRPAANEGRLLARFGATLADVPWIVAMAVGIVGTFCALWAVLP